MISGGQPVKICSKLSVIIVTDVSVVPASVDQPLFQWCQSNPFCGIQLGLVVYFYLSVMAIDSTVTVNKYCEA